MMKLKTIFALLVGASVSANSYPLAFPNATQRNPKIVVAHFMVSNAAPYNVSNWRSDIDLALANGIDGFALNISPGTIYSTQVANAFEAAFGTEFKLFFSLDMTTFPCSNASDAQILRDYVTTYGLHPNHLRYEGKVFVSTFSGEHCLFGQSTVIDGWKYEFLDRLTWFYSVYFVPSFFIDPATFPQYSSVMNGAFNWNGGWPIYLTTSSANVALASVNASVPDNLTPAGQNILKGYIGDISTDQGYWNGLTAMGGSRIYMGAVSPWFFTHYSPQTFNKNWIYLSDYHLYPTRWDSMIAYREYVDIVEIITWNDYGESHYIGPIEGAQPNSQAWVNGFDHQGWLEMTSYYSTAFKTGKYPRISKDRIFLWSRPYAKDANSTDPVGKPTSWELTLDAIWALVFAKGPATVTLSTNCSDAQRFDVEQGVSKLYIPISAGGGMSATMTRDGDTVASLKPNFTFSDQPPSYNFNAFVAASD